MPVPTLCPPGKDPEPRSYPGPGWGGTSSVSTPWGGRDNMHGYSSSWQRLGAFWKLPACMWPWCGGGGQESQPRPPCAGQEAGTRRQEACLWALLPRKGRVLPGPLEASLQQTQESLRQQGMKRAQDKFVEPGLGGGARVTSLRPHGRSVSAHSGRERTYASPAGLWPGG